MSTLRYKLTKFWNEVDLCHVSPAENDIMNEYVVAVEETFDAFTNARSLDDVVRKIVLFYTGYTDEDEIKRIIVGLENVK